MCSIDGVSEPSIKGRGPDNEEGDEGGLLLHHLPTTKEGAQRIEELVGQMERDSWWRSVSVHSPYFYSGSIGSTQYYSGSIGRAGKHSLYTSHRWELEGGQRIVGPCCNTGTAAKQEAPLGWLFGEDKQDQ
ncbi:hypothetical protein SUGI_1475710 [Cryptomeria japonica]|uniref:Uncharacterized protein n=1 Tax=Cryptomeria japonica TaxID=3369 RepID=A0AAD3NVD2_CRYJA|nr:hypothetical protein SUGI_1467120 [Cryptomeria japonica]GLJ58776.1 hypothetical protein SUGI_1475710 [Cryptomeria japonica]